MRPCRTGGREDPSSAARLQPRSVAVGGFASSALSERSRGAHSTGWRRPARGVRDADRRVVRGGDRVGTRRGVLFGLSSVVRARDGREGPPRGTRFESRRAATPAHVGDSHLLRGLGGIWPTDSSNLTSASNSVHPSSKTVSRRCRTMPPERLRLRVRSTGCSTRGLAEIDILWAHGDAPGGSLGVDADVDAFLHRGRPRESLPPAGRSRVGHFRVGHAQHERDRKPNFQDLFGERSAST